MSEQALLAELQDNETILEKTFNKIKGNIEKAQKVDPSDQKRIKTQISNDLKQAQAVIDTIRLEIQSLKEVQNETIYKEKLKKFTATYKSLNEEYKKKLVEQSNQTSVIDNLTVRATGQETSLELMNKGDVILDESGKAIERMDKKVADSKNISNNIKSDLKRQMEQLENTNKNLKEIDYSLGRASKTLGNMAKMVATDKFVMIMIIIIMVLIVGIIVYSNFFADPQKKQSNVLTDIFSSNKVTNSNTKTDIKKFI